MQVVNSATKSGPVVLIVLDGLGIADANKGNAVKLAKTPNFKVLWGNYPHTQLQASGNYVGLPTGVMGNSEVGHMSLGAGKILFQEIARIDRAIKDKSFFSNEVFIKAIEHSKKNNSRLHLMGVLGHGKVHASIDHLFACLDFCKKEGLKGDKVAIHAFTDGRDTPPKSAKSFFELLDEKMSKTKVGKLVSVIGRYYAMDRDEKWDRTRLAYDLLTQGKGTQVKNWKEALEQSYAAGETDQYLKPFLIVDDNPIVVGQNDSVICYNYRADRAVQLSKAFVDDNFQSWKRDKLQNMFFAGFSNYEKGIPTDRSKEDLVEAGDEANFVREHFQEELKKTEKGFPENQIFPPERLQHSLGEVIANHNLTQLRITESEKYPHVTYFFSCRKKDPFNREERIEMPSPRDVKTYDEKPEMSAFEVTERLLKEIDRGVHDFILVNYALTDMVAHTGNLQACVKAVEVADQCTGQVVKAVLERGGKALVTADHGNVEELINLQTGDMDTQHSTNPVPFIYVAQDAGGAAEGAKELPMGMLVDIGPTVLSLLGIDVPEEMTGRNLL